MVSISLCLIVKNEEDVLDTCLQSIFDIVDEINIIDTGSDDLTKEIAKRYHANIYDFKWVNDFARARNFAFSKATKEYILWLDADDVFLEEDRNKLKNLKKDLDPTVDSVRMHYNLSVDQYGNVTSSLMRNRLVRRDCQFKWIGAVHEYLEVGGKIINSDIAVLHNPVHHDATRNLKIYQERLERGEQFSPRDLYYFANELKDHGIYEKAIEYYEKFLAGQKGWIEDNVATCAKLADCYAAIGKQPDSLRSILHSFSYTTPRPEFCCKIANYFFESKDYETAIYWYKMACDVKVSKDTLGTQNRLYSNWIPYIQLCVCFDLLGDYQQAYTYNELAGLTRPSDPKYLHNKDYLEKMLHSICKKVLIASPIRQDPETLKYFLQSLKQLNREGITFTYYFVNDNQDTRSMELLKDFQNEVQGVIIEDITSEEAYLKNHKTHYWKDSLVWKVAKFKDSMIEYAKEREFDYIFLVDSDLVLRKETIQHLIAQKKEVISEVFWTRWQPEAMEQPQVWLTDEYTQFEKKPGEEICNKEENKRYHEFINQLKLPGVYQVGGLGACTLISRSALEKGVCFKKIPNLTFWGEDRHFCIRAGALGVSLWADTHYPPYHIYRQTDLESVKDFIREVGIVETPHKVLHVNVSHKPRITLSMIIKNEGEKYLENVMRRHRDYIDAAVIIDDGSTDNSVAICKEILKNIPLTIISNCESKFSNEIMLRKQQWEKTIETNPDWILNMDADEMFEEGIDSQLRALTNQEDFDLYSFRLYDMWDESNYREDEQWKSHQLYRPFLLRYKTKFTYKWKEQRQHCGRYPENIFQLPNSISQLRIKHLGWSTKDLRVEKYNRYKKLDPNAEYGKREQYESILDPNPKLVKWKK
ncbi:glycosyltransferase [Bacillus sp. Cs-700]|uniref:glycosyltransferase n=1 Tax=Bacillus sp. Cs-700 TaxID=2589818 RepID=UPI00325A5F08